MKPTIFVSHISEEADVAKWLIKSLSQLLLGGVQFIVSSDGITISGNVLWLQKIEEGLRDARIVLALCSSRSVHRPWVNFEAGGAWITNKRVVPVCHAGMHPAALPEPLKSLQGYDLHRGRDFQALVDLLASEAGLKAPDFDPSVVLSDIPPVAKIPEADFGSIQTSISEKRIFIGHGRSLIWRELKDFIAERLSLPWDEFNREPVAGYTTIERLQSMMRQAAFAFLVMTAEEERTDDTLHARPNVIHEIGLFQGRLGLSRAIVLLEEGCSEFSNISGLSQIRFPRNDIAARFEDVRRVLEREGFL